MRCKIETLAVVRDFTFFTGTSNGSETFCTVFIYKFTNLFRFFGVPEVWGMFRLLQTVLFKTDSVFDALFACFDETIDFYQWIKPWKSYITVATIQKQNMNWFATVLRVVICFIILTDLTELSVEFCVDEVIKDRGGLDMRRRRRGKSSSLGIPKAPQVNIQGYSNV